LHSQRQGKAHEAALDDGGEIHVSSTFSKRDSERY
jgi:hypothetical protein